MFNFIEESGRALKNKKLYDNNSFDKEVVKSEISRLVKKEKCLYIDIVDNHGLVSSQFDLEQMRDKRDLIICKAGFGSFAIDAKLNVSPCIYGIGGKKEFFVDNLSEKSIKEVWHSTKFDIFRGGIKIDDLPKCKKCKHKDVCNLKYCRLRPIYEGNNIYDTVSFCKSE